MVMGYARPALKESPFLYCHHQRKTLISCKPAESSFELARQR